MKNLDELTEENIDNICQILLDSKEEQKLMDNPENPNVWMLDFLYDSELRDSLEKLMEKNLLDKTLSSKKENSILKKTKI